MKITIDCELSNCLLNLFSSLHLNNCLISLFVNLNSSHISKSRDNIFNLVSWNILRQIFKLERIHKLILKITYFSLNSSLFEWYSIKFYSSKNCLLRIFTYNWYLVLILVFNYFDLCSYFWKSFLDLFLKVQNVNIL